MFADSGHPLCRLTNGDCPRDHAAAVSAFERLHKCATQSGKSAMAIFAVFKALQKLEELQRPRGQDHSGGSILVPEWVRTGLWLVLETYLLKPMQARGGDIQQTASFKRALNAEWKVYSQWYEMGRLMKEKSVTTNAAAHILAVPGAQWRTQERAYTTVEQFFVRANAPEFDGDAGETRNHVRSRDMVPTKRLLSVFANVRLPY